MRVDAHSRVAQEGLLLSFFFFFDLFEDFLSLASWALHLIAVFSR